MMLPEHDFNFRLGMEVGIIKTLLRPRPKVLLTSVLDEYKAGITEVADAMGYQVEDEVVVSGGCIMRLTRVDPEDTMLLR